MCQATAPFPPAIVGKPTLYLGIGWDRWRSL